MLLVAVLAWPWLRERERRNIVLLSLGLWVMSGVAAGLPLQPRTFLAETILPAFMLFAVAGIGQSLVRVADERRAELDREAEEQAREVRVRARANVLDELRQARHAVATELAHRQRQLEPVLVDEAQRRLSLVDHRFTELAASTS